GMQRIILAGEIGIIHVRGAHQAAVEPIAPAVVGTLDSPWQFPRTSGTHSCAAMPAHVVERPRRAALIARDDNAFTAHFPKEVIPRFADLLRAPRTYPPVKVKLLDFTPEDFRVRVIPCRQSF